MIVLQAAGVLVGFAIALALIGWTVRGALLIYQIPGWLWHRLHGGRDWNWQRLWQR